MYWRHNQYIKLINTSSKISSCISANNPGEWTIVPFLSTHWSLHLIPVDPRWLTLVLMCVIYFRLLSFESWFWVSSLVLRFRVSIYEFRVSVLESKHENLKSRFETRKFKIKIRNSKIETWNPTKLKLETQKYGTHCSDDLDKGL